jgi:hypothetical protein
MTQNKRRFFVKSHTDFRGNEDYNIRPITGSMLQLDISSKELMLREFPKRVWRNGQK